MWSGQLRLAAEASRAQHSWRANDSEHGKAATQTGARFPLCHSFPHTKLVSRRGSGARGGTQVGPSLRLNSHTILTISPWNLPLSFAVIRHSDTTYSPEQAQLDATFGACVSLAERGRRSDGSNVLQPR